MRQRRSLTGLRLTCCVCAAMPWLPASRAEAALQIDASATTQYEYNSNVYDLQPGFPIPGVPGETRRADSFIAYGGVLQANELWQQQKFFVDILGTDYHYQHFSQLNRTDYTLDAGWNWRLGLLFDGKIDVAHLRSLVPLEELIGTHSVIQTEQRETANGGLQFTPDWRIEATGIDRHVDEPLSLSPNLSLHETSEELVLKFVRNAGLTAGVGVLHLSGDFQGVPAALAPSYTQDTADLQADYKPTGRTTVVGELGYTRRTSGTAVNDLSGATGKVDFKEALTGKTSMDLKLSRLITSYITNTGSEIDSVADLLVNWQATHKIGVSGGYEWTYRFLPLQGNLPGTDRKDHFQYSTLQVDYEPIRSLAIKPYLRYQNRTSDFTGGNFNATLYGVYFSYLWQKGK